MSSSYRLPSGESELAGACAFDGGLCAWAGRATYRWTPEAGWSTLSSAPTAVDSAFELQSGVLAGAGTHVGFLSKGGDEWAGWVDLSSFSDAHPLYGDLLLCIDASTEAYGLFGVSESGLDPISSFSADELADPVAGWSAPTNPERLLLLGEGGLWALSPPYGGSDLQHLVSFDAVELPPFDEIPGPFQPGPATVVIPRRDRTALRLDLSDGTGHATGLAHLPGGTALWRAYLAEDRDQAARLLSALATLPSPPENQTIRLHDVLMGDGSIRAFATSAGISVPPDEIDGPPSAAALSEAPLDASVLLTWALWLGWDGARAAACRRVCNAAEPIDALVESLRVFEGVEAIRALFDLLRSDDPPAGPDGDYHFPAEALRSLAASVGAEAASLVTSGLSGDAVPVRVAACAMAGATRADLAGDGGDDANATLSVLWPEDNPIPKATLLENVSHEHPVVRAAARATCERLSIEMPSSPASS